MNRTTTHSSFLFTFILTMIDMMFFIITDQTGNFFFCIIGLIFGAIIFLNLDIKGGYAASENEIQIWDWWIIHNSIDYSSIQLIDIKVKYAFFTRRLEKRLIFIMIIKTDHGKYKIYDEKNDFYKNNILKDADSKQELIESSDLMKLKKFIESHIYY